MRICDKPAATCASHLVSCAAFEFIELPGKK
jgi:hypothetical protein